MRIPNPIGASDRNTSASGPGRVDWRPFKLDNENQVGVPGMRPTETGRRNFGDGILFPIDRAGLIRVQLLPSTIHGAATGGARLNLEARALAAVSGVKEDRSAARISLSAANAGQRRHIIAHGLIALEREFSFRRC